MAWRSLKRALTCETDIASLAAFRCLFGVLLAVSCVRFVAKGYLHAQLIAPSFHFPYGPLSFVAPLPGPWMYGVFALLVATACGIALGIGYRACTVCFSCLFCYVELIDRASYLNHYYLVALLCCLLALLPLDRALSLRTRAAPEQTIGSLPRYVLWTLRAQVAVVYVFAGLAKLNTDWLIDAQPLRMWLGPHQGLPWIGGWLGSPSVAQALSVAGALFDLSVVPCLLWPRARRFALALALIFHFATGLLFPIGMFPWIMTACLSLFLPPDWPRRFLPAARAQAADHGPGRGVQGVLALHLAIQIGFPLYAHLAHRDAAWTYRGFDFAWRVMVAEKSGSVELALHEPGRPPALVPIARYLTPLQRRALVQDPAMLCAFARALADEAAEVGRSVRVTADAFVSLNGKPAARWVDPRADLARANPDDVLLAQ